MLPACDVLACHKVHLSWEGAAHKQRIKVGDVVGEHDVVIGQIFCYPAGIAEFEIAEKSDGVTQHLPKEIESFLHGQILRSKIVLPKMA